MLAELRVRKSGCGVDIDLVPFCKGRDMLCPTGWEQNRRRSPRDVQAGWVGHRLSAVRTGIRIEESWLRRRPYRWLAERSQFRSGCRKLIHRESFRASVLHSSDTPAVKITAREICLLTTPSLLSSGTPSLGVKGLPRAAYNQYCSAPFLRASVVRATKFISGFASTNPEPRFTRS